LKDSSASSDSLATAFDSQNPPTEKLDLEFSTITDAIDPTVITDPGIGEGATISTNTTLTLFSPALICA